MPASSEKIPVYIKSGGIVPWAEVGLHAGAPEARRLTIRVYGDGSLPFTLHDGKDTLRLSWSGDQGSAEGATSYDVVAWKRMG